MPVVDSVLLEQMQREVSAVVVEDKIFNYIYEIVKATRRSNDILVGGSPRAGIALLNCGKAVAALRGRDFVIPDDVKDLSLPVLPSRLALYGGRWPGPAAFRAQCQSSLASSDVALAGGWPIDSY